MASFEALPTDLCFLLLKDSPTIQTLWGYIRASSRMYTLFRENRENILSVVVARDIGNELMGDAITALRSSRFEFRGLCLKSALIKWIPIYQEELKRGNSVSRLLAVPDTLPLWRLHRYVKALAEYFVREKLQVLNGINDPEEGSTSSKQDLGVHYLSSIERIRVFRSIYRYMIFGNVFYMDEKRPGVGWKKNWNKRIDARDKSDYFLSLFPAWQVEELSCINDFIRDKILCKWQEVEDDHFNLIAPDPDSWDIDTKYDNRWDETFFGIGMKGSFPEMQQTFETLPFSDLAEIFSAKGGTLSLLVQKHAHQLEAFQTEFLDEGLDDCTYAYRHMTPEYLQHEVDLANGVKVMFDGDAYDKANQAWRWAHEYDPCDLYAVSRDEFPIGEGLRQFGYVFWDSDRLKRLGIFHREPSQVAGGILVNFPRPLYNKDSVETRIRKLAGKLANPS